MKKIDNQAALERMIKRYLAGKANQEEIAFLEAYFEHFDQREDIFANITPAEKQDLGLHMEAAISRQLAKNEQPKIWKLQTLAKIAAAIVIIVSIGLYLTHSNSKNEMYSVAELTAEHNISPGGNRALLTLADGKKISLDDARIGELTKQGNVVIKKSGNGQLIYHVDEADLGATVALNTIETPRGGTYEVELPDGTRVWLNAGSKLTFPTAFRGADRRVELTGEAYFEVAKNKRRPFFVSSGNQMVQVLGTHFNISAYPEEQGIKTTLLEGSVRVANQQTKQSALLVPGQQSIVRPAGKIFVGTANTSDAIAWKNGYFAFSDENIASVMNKIARWYDVEVVYQGKITQEGFVGSVSRYEKIAEVLGTLELTGLVHFKVSPGDASGKGRRVIVMP